MVFNLFIVRLTICRFETSAKSNCNIDEAMEVLIKEILERLKQENPDYPSEQDYGSFRLTDKSKKELRESNCCS